MTTIKIKNMKNQLRYIALMLAVCIGSCVDEEKNPIPDFTRSSIPVFTPGTSDTGFIDYLDFGNSNLSFAVDKKGTEPVQNIDVTITFNNSQTGVSNMVKLSTVSSMPQEINLTFDELLAQFSPEVVTADTLGLGDSFVVNGNVLLADGRYLTASYSPSVVANDQVFLTYNVACASNLGGTYDLTLVSGDNGEVSSLSNQTITQVSPGYYEISDMTMDIFGPNFPVKYRFTDICGTLTADVGSVDYGTQITVKINPGTSIDPVTGEITFEIEYIAPSCCGLEGIKTVFKATPK
jgi:hypothetical protein